MINTKTLLLAGFALTASAGAALAAGYDASGNYNAPIGMSSTSQMNSPVTASLRDANGNLAVVNGQITSSSFTEVGGVQAFSPSTGGVGGTVGSASAIGNQLNVVTTGSNNIVIVDSNQINNGNQTANNTVN
jgi:holdfast attachment protein HfaA